MLNRTLRGHEEKIDAESVKKAVGRVSGEENPRLFEDLEEYGWLVENAGRFGFVLSYPKGQPGITFEPWHWRYENPAEIN